MPSWGQVLKEIQDSNRVDALDYIRRKYLIELNKKTGRNLLCYYSGWLQKPKVSRTDINDDDINGLMATIHGMDRSKGLDLILHTPGGEVAATEGIVVYLRKMFGDNINAYVPQIAMSAGTMMACACKRIYMGKQSSLGPIDPQFGGIPAFGVIEEFNRAMKEVKADPSRAQIWKAIIGKYHPTFIGECENSIKWSKDIAETWLSTGMFKSESNPAKKSKDVVAYLQNRALMLNHARHLSADECEKIGLVIERLENDQSLQDLVLTIHHAFMHTFNNSTAIKIIENHMGIASVIHAQVVNRPSQI